jgi:hypothetical protein
MPASAQRFMQRMHHPLGLLVVRKHRKMFEQQRHSAFPIQRRVNLNSEP